MVSHLFHRYNMTPYGYFIYVHFDLFLDSQQNAHYHLPHQQLHIQFNNICICFQYNRSDLSTNNFAMVIVIIIIIVAIIFSYDTKICNGIKFILYYSVKRHTYYTISMILNLFNYTLLFLVSIIALLLI